MRTAPPTARVVVERGTALTNNPAAPRLGFAFASTEGKMIKKTGMGVVLAVLLMASPAATLSQTGAVAAVADKTLAVFGQNIHYWDAGSGPVVVLVHGLVAAKKETGEECSNHCPRNTG